MSLYCAGNWKLLTPIKTYKLEQLEGKLYEEDQSSTKYIPSSYLMYNPHSYLSVETLSDVEVITHRYYVALRFNKRALRKISLRQRQSTGASQAILRKFTRKSCPIIYLKFINLHVYWRATIAIRVTNSPSWKA